MSCNRCAATTEAVAPTAGAGHIEANWAGNRTHPQYCDDCHGFLRADGGCTRCETRKISVAQEQKHAAQLAVFEKKFRAGNILQSALRNAGNPDWATDAGQVLACDGSRVDAADPELAQAHQLIRTILAAEVTDSSWRNAAVQLSHDLTQGPLISDADLTGVVEACNAHYRQKKGEQWDSLTVLAILKRIEGRHGLFRSPLSADTSRQLLVDMKAECVKSLPSGGGGQPIYRSELVRQLAMYALGDTDFGHLPKKGQYDPFRHRPATPTPPAPMAAPSGKYAPFPDEDVLAVVESLGLTPNRDKTSWGVESKTTGLINYIGFANNGPTLCGQSLNKISAERAAKLFKQTARAVPAEERPRIRALQQYIDKRLRDSRRNLPLKPGADLCLAHLEGLPLQETDLRGADLRGARLWQANLERADLSGADLSDAQLRSARLYRVNLTGANLRNTDLDGADLSEADLRHANLRHAGLGGANLTWANLRNADLEGAYLYGADLGYADLTGADLGGADLTEADLTGATWDNNTVWPRGFEPSSEADDDL